MDNGSLEMAKVLFQKRHLSSSLDKVHIKIDHLILLHLNYVRWTTIISEVYQIVVYPGQYGYTAPINLSKSYKNLFNMR